MKLTRLASPNGKNELISFGIRSTHIVFFFRSDGQNSKNTSSFDIMEKLRWICVFSGSKKQLKQ